MRGLQIVSVGMNWRNCTGLTEAVESFSTVIVPAYKEQLDFCSDSSVTRREVGKEVLIVFSASPPILEVWRREVRGGLDG